MFSLSNGLAALTAYGIIMLVNEKISDKLRLTLAEQSKKKNLALIIRDYLYLLGVLFLSGSIGHIVIASDIFPSKFRNEIEVIIISMALAAPITLFHRPLFILTFKSLLRGKPSVDEERFVDSIYVIWIFGLIGFIISNNALYIILWVLTLGSAILGSLFASRNGIVRIILFLSTLAIFIASFFY